MILTTLSSFNKFGERQNKSSSIEDGEEHDLLFSNENVDLSKVSTHEKYSALYSSNGLTTNSDAKFQKQF